MTDSTERFNHDLEASIVAVERVAGYYRNRGFGVIIHPVNYADETYDLEKVDQGDLTILGNRRAFTIDVKRRGFTFTGPDDFPYPSILVANTHQHDRFACDGYVTLDASMKYAAIVRSSSFREWTERGFYDAVHGRNRRAYFCPTEHARFLEVPE